MQREVWSYQTSQVVAYSLLFPLDKCLVLSSDGKELISLLSENSTRNMLTMSNIRTRLVRIVDNRVIENVEQSPVITWSKQASLFANGNSINMRAIFWIWMDSLHIPAELDSRSCPFFLFRVCHTSGIVCLINDVEVQFLIGTALRSDVRAVLAPVEGCHKWIVLCEWLVKCVFTCITNWVYINDVVVGAGGEEVFAWWVSHDFAPLLSFFERTDFLVEVIIVTNRNLAHIVGKSLKCLNFCELNVAKVELQKTSQKIAKITKIVLFQRFYY